jgi:ATP-dependent DNA helicase RecG
VSSTLLVTSLKGVGPKLAEHLAQLQIITIDDLLFHLPLRYEDRSRVRTIASVRAGDRVLIEGRIQSTQFVGKKQYLKCLVTDMNGAPFELIFFYFARNHEKRLKQMRGMVRFFGEMRRGHLGEWEMIHPEYASVDAIESESVLSLSPCLAPIYPSTKGLHQVTLRKLMRQALELLDRGHCLPELLPDAILKKYEFVSLREALHFVHFPPIDVDVDALLQGKYPQFQRLVFEELIAHQLSLQQLRNQIRSRNAIALSDSIQLAEKLKQQLSFDLTGAQQRVIAEITHDLTQSSPMLRLLQGDVGSGKTIVACFAALNAIEAGYQVALMAPTEILAEQHVKNFSQWLSPLNIRVELLLGRQTAKEQADIKFRLASGQIQLIVGTHALFQNDVEFHDLCLLIIDEQHRFGVDQRLALMQKGLKTHRFPHQLMMTATPIPRTLAMTAYADLDFSVIDELPPNRKPISTVLIASEKRDEIISRVRVNCQQKKQAYWVCTLIEESDVAQCQAAETTATYLQESLPELRVGLIHGRLKSDEKNTVMRAFAEGEIDLLVATTVIEVGVDVPNASLMIIENPERLGLPQLHQLRGRIGRGSEASFCVLLYQHPLSTIAKKRLTLMRETQDGFVIAQEDLQMRGPGEVLGARQSGVAQLRVADFMRDQSLLQAAQITAQDLLRLHSDVAATLVDRWIGENTQYIHT